MVRSRFDRLFIPLLAGLIGLYLATFLYYAAAAVITVPYLDLLDWILRYDQYWRAGDWWHYLWLPDVGHRPMLSMLLTLADIEWCRGTTLPFLLSSSAGLLLTVGGLVWTIWLADLAIGMKAILTAAIILLLATSCVAASDIAQPFGAPNFHTIGLFVIALLLFDGVGEEGPGTPIRRAIAVVAAVFAAFGIVGGLLAPLLLLWVAWAGGLSRAWLIAIGLTAVMLFATYLYLPGNPTGEAIQLLDLAALPTLADYYVRLLGLPWSHVASLVWCGRIVGYIVLGASIVTLFRCGILRRSVGRLERIGLALLMFSLLLIAMITVGRWYWTTDRPMSIRYTVFVALLEAGLLLANTGWLNSLWQKGHRRPLQWVTLGVASVLLVQQVAAGQAAVAVTNQIKNSYRQFVGGQQGDATDRPVFYGSPAERERVLQIMRALRIYQN